jgi:hypothetical protein
MAYKTIHVPFGKEEYYKLVEEGAKKQKDPDEYVRDLIISELDIEKTDGTYETFGEFVVDELGVSGSKRRENVRSVAQHLFEELDLEAIDNEVPWETWNEATTARAAAVAEATGKDQDTYKSTVRANCTTDIGIDGVQQFRERVVELAKEYHSRT